MQNWHVRLGALAAALWWGSLSTLFVMVPLVFASLPLRSMAGNTAAHLFTAQSWISLGCTVLLLALVRVNDTSAEEVEGEDAHRADAGASGRVRSLLFFVMLGLLLALLTEYAVAPHIVARERLAFWHTLSVSMLAVQWVCALVVLWRLLGSACRAPSRLA
ncbi:MAG: DUF4149 domain-containing protein [Burkholderiaceae bacterium]|jgi:hypothetical protein|nr:DUF4149 domain-containing protein [Burkholderiaceae bacterium]